MVAHERLTSHVSQKRTPCKTKEFLRFPAFLWHDGILMNLKFQPEFLSHFVSIEFWLTEFKSFCSELNFLFSFFKSTFLTFIPDFVEVEEFDENETFDKVFKVFSFFLESSDIFYFNLAFEIVFQNSAMTIFSWKINVFVRMSLVPYLVDKCA